MKIGPYNSIKQGLSKYESIKLLTLEKYDPNIDLEKAKELVKTKKLNLSKIDLAITSELKRAKDSADFLLSQGLINSDTKLEQDILLNEILFDISKMCSEEEYEKEGSNIIRQKFIDFFITDKLEESRENIKKRILACNKKIKSLKGSYDNILIISHTFFLKLFLIFKEEPNLFENPGIIKKYINSKKHIMEFFEINQ